MREELSALTRAIDHSALPLTFDDLFHNMWDPDARRFNVQETYLLDYKDKLPDKLTDSFGSSIVRLALAFYNSYGGIIIFGVKDRSLSVCGIDQPFDIEVFNRFLSDLTGFSIECVSRLYRIPGEGPSFNVGVVLVPRRGFRKPAELLRPLDKYPAGQIWIRDRHEVLKAETRHLPVLFSDRRTLPDEGEPHRFPVHRSLPPSPATVKEFVNRGSLLTSLWSWFIFGDQPRMYLHGTGGSGKSTLAFEFSLLLSEHGHSVRSSTGERVDYVLYLSAKETELNTYSGQEQIYQLRNFSTADEQISQILFHSGMIKDVSSLENETFSEQIDELFNNFSGLIVIDDIDALSRKGVDTGEETLFIKAIRARKRTKILYTLRFPPSHAVGSSKHVKGLSEIEFFDFLGACCAQFEVPLPQSEIIPHIMSETNSLPLLVEAVIGLRRYCGTYNESLDHFSSKGGDEARRYLYQREYDRLESAGKSRQVLTALVLVEEPVSFSTISSLFQFPPEQVREALGECSSIFLSTFDGENGETLYQLAPPAIPFIKRVSESLFYFAKLKAHVQHFRAQGTKSSPEERALLVRLNSLIRGSNFEEIVSIGEGFSKDDPILVNPSIRSLLGQAYSETGPGNREKARESFKHAEGLGHRDFFMMRRWFNMELLSGYGLPEAERICQAVISDERFNSRIKCEFWSKLGSCHSHRAFSLMNVSREKGMEHLKQAIVAYMEGLWIAATVKDLDTSENLIWLERPLRMLVREMNSEVEIYFDVIDRLIERRHDVELRGITLLIEYLTRSPAPDDISLRVKVRGLINRTLGKIRKIHKTEPTPPGINHLSSSMMSFSSAI